MFGLFGSRPALTKTSVHSDVGAPLVRATAFPTVMAQAPGSEIGSCAPVAIAGQPPAAVFAAQFVDGQTTTGYHVTGMPGQPSLALVNIATAPFNFELWELGSAGDKSIFRTQRRLSIDPAQDKWGSLRATGVACLPAKQLLIAIKHSAPAPQGALYRYDVAGNLFSKLADIERNVRNLDTWFETRLVAPDAVLVLYYTDKLRLASEIYTNAQNHLLLFSPRYPQGLEVLNLGNDDGSIVRWTVIGKTLWLDTVDGRKPQKPLSYVWSLDLSKLL